MPSHAFQETTLKSLDATKPLDAKIAVCSTCTHKALGLGYFRKNESGFEWEEISDDQENFVLDTSQMGAAVIPETENGGNHYRVILGPAFHNDLGIGLLRSVLWHPILTDNICWCLESCEFEKISRPDRISIEIDGYSDDSRSLDQIPAIAKLFYQIHKQVFAIEYWMDAEQLQLFVNVAAKGMPESDKTEAVQSQRALKQAMGIESSTTDTQGDVVRWLLVEALSQIESFVTRNLVMIRLPAQFKEEATTGLLQNSALFQMANADTLA